MLQGAGSGAWEWSIWRRVFEAGGLPVDAFDLTPSDALGSTQYEHYLRQVRDQIVTSKPTLLMGASLGGLLVAEAMSENIYAESVQALILLLPNAPSGETTGRRMCGKNLF